MHMTQKENFNISLLNQQTQFTSNL
ncbi:hypothetical protein M8C21_022600 [Ambrosia artemisiifolia]|uniref:Uncharacterized protein n=1 Tax=Ambrosia artemisiifolia TaxID=4212 RepID=A0AAD5GGF1_AMBAR|nr:hypothetical protein M8C21_022600 [Ambrosia artemisiifolia]